MKLLFIIITFYCFLLIASIKLLFLCCLCTQFVWYKMFCFFSFWYLKHAGTSTRSRSKLAADGRVNGRQRGLADGQTATHSSSCCTGPSALGPPRPSRGAAVGQVGMVGGGIRRERKGRFFFYYSPQPRPLGCPPLSTHLRALPSLTPPPHHHHHFPVFLG